MRFPVTQKTLLDWAGPQVFKIGQSFFDAGRVLKAEYEHPFVRGELAYGNRSIHCQFELHPDGSAENQCPCHDSTERGVICPHVVALGLELVRRNTDPERERKAQEELRRAARLAETDESKYLRRTTRDVPGSVPAKLRLFLASNWADGVRQGRVPVAVALESDGHVERIDRLPTDVPYLLSPKDESILFVLEDISEGPARGRIDLSLPDFLNVLGLHAGKPLDIDGRAGPVTVNAARMASVLRMDLDRENGELILVVHTELPFKDPSDFPVYVVAGKTGWVYHAGHFWPLERLLPAPLHSIYRNPVVIPRLGVPRFLQVELPVIEQLLRVETDLSIDLFTLEPGAPKFRLTVRGSPASLAATLHAEYDGISLVAGKADAAGQFALPDPDDLMRYTVRNPAAETRALERLAVTGFAGEHGEDLKPIVGSREVLNFLGAGVPRLRRLGWKVELEGSVRSLMDSSDLATPVVRIADSSAGWFDVGFEYEDGKGQSLSEAEIQRALLKGDAFVERGGRTILLDADAIATAKQVFADCASGEGGAPGTFRLDGVYAAYVKSSLDALDGIDIEAAEAWQARARAQNRAQRLEPVALPSALETTLRPYQKNGVYWLRFLEGGGFAGILADEMGLGKTVQMLAWMQLQRAHADAAGKPALVVCPTSLVENWAEEAARFVPGLRVLVLSGAERHGRRDEIARSDLVVTSYALLRRDVENYTGLTFSAVILDEAQHIKNRSTQNAVAAKKLKAAHRFVLTGTPIENSVADLWSIMDFLMPGYLGGPKPFRENYELPIAAGGPGAEQAQARLRRKLHPFLLRRLKRDVAKDLPPRIDRLASCSLTRDQQMVYKELLEASARKIGDLVAAQGFDRSRMEILKTLLRLRQVCCHLDLLKLQDLKSEYPSGKMDLLFELLDEAFDAGHRVLVFSQFTSMLAILRQELERRDLRYCYLDGATKERLKVVHEFNTERAIPLFLISLKAGGTGLNLTGADMVIHYDPWWNPAVEDQATDRAHRIGQKNTVYSVKLITRDTVEEKVLAMQKKKRAVIDATLTQDEQVMQKLTWEDVQELLSL